MAELCVAIDGAWPAMAWIECSLFSFPVAVGADYVALSSFKFPKRLLAKNRAHASPRPISEFTP